MIYFKEVQRKLQLLLIKLPQKHTIDLTNTQDFTILFNLQLLNKRSKHFFVLIHTK